MFSVKPLALTAVCVSAIFAGCATTSGGGLETSAQRLERSTDRMLDEARDGSASSDYLEDARAFAEEARDFNRVLDNRGAESNDVREAFRDLSDRYHALREEVEQENSAELESSFEDVTEAYLDIQRDMRRHRVASE